MPSKYSIVIPTYNHLEDCLKPCIKSIIENSYIKHRILFHVPVL
jgi:glycosyltransferase involved in cell wall biosynthesis